MMQKLKTTGLLIQDVYSCNKEIILQQNHDLGLFKFCKALPLNSRRARSNDKLEPHRGLFECLTTNEQ